MELESIFNTQVSYKGRIVFIILLFQRRFKVIHSQFHNNNSYPGNGSRGDGNSLSEAGQPTQHATHGAARNEWARPAPTNKAPGWPLLLRAQRSGGGNHRDVSQFNKGSNFRNQPDSNKVTLLTTILHACPRDGTIARK